MNQTLYEIDSDYRATLEEAEAHASEHEGEIAPDLSDKLDAITAERDRKIGNICRYIKNKLAESEACSVEVGRLAARATAAEHAAEWAKTYLAAVVGAGNKWQDATSKLSWRKSERVEVTVEPETLPADVVRIIPATTQADKKAIKAALDSGRTIEGCAIVQHVSLQVK